MSNVDGAAAGGVGEFCERGRGRDGLSEPGGVRGVDEEMVFKKEASHFMSLRESWGKRMVIINLWNHAPGAIITAHDPRV